MSVTRSAADRALAGRPAARSPERSSGSVHSAAHRAASGLVHLGQAAACRPWRWAMTARGVDVTVRSARRSCLVLAPHPDDETLGCGATIARKTAAGTPTWVMVVADGRSSHPFSRITPDELAAIRAAEVDTACRSLGVGAGRLRRLEWADATVAARTEELATIIAAAVDDLCPEEVVVTSGLDWHPDHQALNQAARLALTRVTHRAQLLEYPVWHWARGPWSHRQGSKLSKARDLVAEPWSSLRGSRPQLVSTGPYLERKAGALACYRSQLRNLTGEPDWAVLDDRFLRAFLRPYELFLPAG